MTGWVRAAPEDTVQGAAPGTVALALIGANGPAMWEAFAAAPEYGDARPHPMDRWSRRVIGRAACALSAKAHFPFGGPPYRPFLTWAMAAEGAVSSPLGMVVTPERGLMASWRGALAFRHVPDGAAGGLGDEPQGCVGGGGKGAGRGTGGAATSGVPCAECFRPCADACPVGAFADGGFDPGRCRAHLSSAAGAPCREGGCIARSACPLSLDLPQAERAFHLAAFHRSSATGA
ncbi:MAG: ferredoxin [Pseudomonadota bacterium]